MPCCIILSLLWHQLVLFPVSFCCNFFFWHFDCDMCFRYVNLYTTNSKLHRTKNDWLCFMSSWFLPECPCLSAKWCVLWLGCCVSLIRCWLVLIPWVFLLQFLLAFAIVTGFHINYILIFVKQSNWLCIISADILTFIWCFYGKMFLILFSYFVFTFSECLWFFFSDWYDCVCCSSPLTSIMFHWYFWIDDFDNSYYSVNVLLFKISFLSEYLLFSYLNIKSLCTVVTLY